MVFFINPRASSQSVEEQEMAIAENIAKQQVAKEQFISGAKNLKKETISPSARRGVGFQVGSAAGVAMRQQVSFSPEQEMLGQMFGQGDKIWGVNNEPVRINNDLNSSRSDPWDETSSMFGFGDFSERSGLF